MHRIEDDHTLGETRTQQTRNLLDQALGSDERIVLPRELLDQLLVLVQLLEILGAHGVHSSVLGAIDVVLVAEDADAHARARDTGQLDGAGETLVTLGVVVLEADLELDGLEEVALLLLVGVLQELLHVGTHTSDRDLRHDDAGLPITTCRVVIGTAFAFALFGRERPTWGMQRQKVKFEILGLA